MGKNGQFQRLLVSEFWEGFWLKSQARVWGCLSQGGQICPKNTPKNVPIYPFRVQLKQPNSFSCITTADAWQSIDGKPAFEANFWPKVKQKCGELPTRVPKQLYFLYIRDIGDPENWTTPFGGDWIDRPPFGLDRDPLWDWTDPFKTGIVAQFRPTILGP